MRPSADRICQEETSGAKYYDRMVTAFLRREPSEDELQALVDSVNGTLTGQIRGAVDYVQIELPESGFDKIQQAAEMLMENELVRYADCDYPVDICENVDETVQIHGAKSKIQRAANMMKANPAAITGGQSASVRIRHGG